jgi:hypothetical protein
MFDVENVRIFDIAFYSHCMLLIFCKTMYPFRYSQGLPFYVFCPLLHHLKDIEFIPSSRRCHIAGSQSFTMHSTINDHWSILRPFTYFLSAWLERVALSHCPEGVVYAVCARSGCVQVRLLPSYDIAFWSSLYIISYPLNFRKGSSLDTPDALSHAVRA